LRPSWPRQRKAVAEGNQEADPVSPPTRYRETKLSSKDDRAMDKAMALMKAHQDVPPKLREMGHLAAAKRIESEGGRWDSPEVRDASRRNSGNER